MRPWRVIVAVVSLLAIALVAGCGNDDEESGGPAKETTAGQWRTWLLHSGSEIEVPPPPKEGSAAAERDEEALQRAVDRRTPEQEAIARQYTRAPVVEPWLDQNMELVASLPKDPPASSRNYALTSVAMQDAAIASYHWKYEYDREAPDTESSVEPSSDPSYPSEHAAIAGAASRTLAHLYPKYPRARLEQRAERVAQSLVAAGVARPSDVEAGLELGRKIAEKAIDHAESDGFDRRWDGKRPRGPEHWEPPPGSASKPNQPLAGTWKQWLTKSNDQFRPPPPPKYGTKEFVANAREVMRVKEELTPRQKRIARYWEAGPGTPLPAGVWNRQVLAYLRDKDLSVPRQARVLALVNVAMADAGGQCWNAKYQTGWWDPRPINAIRDLGLDKRWKPLLGTPSFPAYPSGTSNYSGAASEVLAYLFPDDAAMWRQTGREAAMSRLWGGVHWKIDVTEGIKMGRKAGALAVERAKSDGAEPSSAS